MEHWESLEAIVRATGEDLEGNCVYENKTLQRNPLLDSKRRNYARAAAGTRRICEIGFNAGHSALEFLKVSPTSTYVFFDLCEHAYTQPCADYLQAVYQTPMTFVFGDSRVTLPRWIQANPAALGTFDLVHVDGGHTKECATSDLLCAYLLTRVGGIILVDDINSKKIMPAVNAWMAQGVLQIDPTFEATSLYPHAVLRKVV
jgi:predicted O-methyltransferase YrrM